MDRAQLPSLSLAILDELEINNHIFAFPHTICVNAGFPGVIHSVDRILAHMVDVAVAVKDDLVLAKVHLAIGEPQQHSFCSWIIGVPDTLPGRFHQKV